MKERVKELRKKLGLTLEKFGEKLGVTKQTVSRIENGVNSLTDQMFKSICREFNVNEEWLRNGTGEMLKPTPSDALYKLKQDYNLSEADYIMVEKFVSLRPETRQAVFNYMKEVASSFERSGVEPFSPAYGNVPPRLMGDVLNARPETGSSHKPSIEEQVEDYRRQLEAEEKAAGESPALRKDA